MKIGYNRVLKIYIAVVLYCSLLRLVLGRWGTLASDIATVCALLYCLGPREDYLFHYSKRVRSILILVLLVELIAIAEMFHPNIRNRLYSLIEYRKSYFQLISLLAAFLLYARCTVPLEEMIDFIGNLCIPIVLYGIKQRFFWTGIDSRLVDMTDAGYYTMVYSGMSRSVSIFSGPFHYGLFCVMATAIFLYLWSALRKKRYLFWMLVSAFGCYCSYTRTNLACLIAVAGVYFAMYLIKERNANSGLVKSVAVFLAIAAGILYAGGVLNLSLGSSRLNAMLRSIMNAGNDSRFLGRIDTWKAALTNILRYPLFGLGIGSAADTMSKYSVARIYVSTAHNMYLKVGMELGVAGGILYMMIFPMLYGKLRRWRNYRARALFYSCTATLLLNGLMGSTLSAFPSVTLYWILCGILLAQLHAREWRIFRNLMREQEKNER